MTLATSYPLISVIMPCYNSEAFIEYSIKSVFQQTYPNIELIIVDDGSTDQSAAIIHDAAKKYPALNVFSQANAGPYPARNLGLQHSSGEFIAFLDADDYWAVDCLQKLYDGLINAKADLSYCGWQNVVDNGTNGLPYVPPAYEKSNITDAFLSNCPWPIHAALLRKTLVDTVGGFSTRCFSAMDYDFWLRISAVSDNIVLVPEVLAFYRWHQQGQISAVKWRQVLDARQVRLDFVAQNQHKIQHLAAETIAELTDGVLLAHAREAFWKRDLISAQKLFRAVFMIRCWQVKDLKHILPALLPLSVYRRLVMRLEK